MKDSVCVACWMAGKDLVGVKVMDRRIMAVAFHLSSGPFGVIRCHRSDVDLGNLRSGNILISVNPIASSTVRIILFLSNP